MSGKPSLPSAPEFEGIDRARFEFEIVPAGRPAILRSAVAHWPIVTAALESSAKVADYLRERATGEAAEAWFAEPEIGGRFGFNATLDGFNHDRRKATIAQLLDLLLRQQGAPEPYGVYAGAMPLRRHAPRVITENDMPLLAPDRYMLISLWLGNRTRTAAHWDLSQNLACVVAGRRTFTLFPTSQVANLYVGPLDFTLAGQPSSLADMEEPDFDRFPRLRDAFAAAEVADLAPGDVLYMPSLWWHAAQSQDEFSALINYWWRDGPARTISPQFSLLHALMTMRELPEPERAAWRDLFNHYLFRDGGDPAEHLPEDARGVLGPQNPEQLAQLKANLAAALQSRS
jgi:hypothetical protein